MRRTHLVLGPEFVRNWCMHVLPKEYTKVRPYGVWSCSKRTEYRQLCARLIANQSETSRNQACERSLAKPPKKTAPDCPHCGKCMQVLRAEDRPSWRDVFAGNGHPEWFQPINIECEFPQEPKALWEHAHAMQRWEEPDIFDELIAMRQALMPNG